MCCSHCRVAAEESRPHRPKPKFRTDRLSPPSGFYPLMHCTSQKVGNDHSDEIGRLTFLAASLAHGQGPFEKTRTSSQATRADTFHHVQSAPRGMGIRCMKRASTPRSADPPLSPNRRDPKMDESRKINRTTTDWWVFLSILSVAYN